MTLRLKNAYTSATLRTSAIFLTGIISRSFKIFDSISSTSPKFSWGMMTLVMPLLFAAISYSFKPPIFRTLPANVISPVIARLAFTFFSIAREVIAVHIVMPALGPSFGVAPSGTCI